MTVIDLYFICLSCSPAEQQQLHYPSSDAQYPGSVGTLPFHPALLEHYLPAAAGAVAVPTSHRAEGRATPATLPRDGGGERTPCSEGDDSDGGERSEGELVLLTD